MFNRILVPIDFSRASNAAAAYARSLAGTTGATVHLLHVMDDEITRYARAHNIDLIVMGAHGRGRGARSLLDSVTEKVARTAPCPVLTIRETRSSSGAKGRRRILVPTDFSPCSDAALGCAKLVAAEARASICLLHVIDQRAIGIPFGSESCAPDLLEAQQDQVANARIELGSRMLADSRSRASTTGDIVFGASSAMISAYAADHAVDLIVMGTHGRTGIAHLVMGSVAASVIRTARCPVLTVKSRDAAQALVSRAS
jgi:nucleotide-binding universal stress UspA family protein